MRIVPMIGVHRVTWRCVSAIGANALVVAVQTDGLHERMQCQAAHLLLAWNLIVIQMDEHTLTSSRGRDEARRRSVDLVPAAHVHSGRLHAHPRSSLDHGRVLFEHLLHSDDARIARHDHHLADAIHRRKLSNEQRQPVDPLAERGNDGGRISARLPHVLNPPLRLPRALADHLHLCTCQHLPHVGAVAAGSVASPRLAPAVVPQHSTFVSRLLVLAHWV